MREINMRVILMMILMVLVADRADSLSERVVSEIRLQYRTMVAEFLRTVKVKNAHT